MAPIKLWGLSVWGFLAYFIEKLSHDFGFTEKELSYSKADHKNLERQDCGISQSITLLLLFCIKYSKEIVAYSAI